MRDLTGHMVAVTGASGYVAGALIPALEQSGARVLRVSRAPLASSRPDDVVADLGDRAAWDHIVDRADTIIHLAAATSAYEAEAEPLANMNANVTPVLHLVAAAGALGRKPRVILAGTSTQVGVPSLAMTDESVPDHPVTAYCLNKLMAEKHLLLASHNGHVRGTCLRLANVYGPSPQASQAADRGILNKVVRRALDGQAITIFGGGDYLRDYIFIDDVVRAFVAVTRVDDGVDGRFFNLCTGRGVAFGSAFRLAAETVYRLTGRRTLILDAPWPEASLPVEFRTFASRPDALIKASGWTPCVTLEDGLERTVRAFMAGQSDRS